MRVVRMPLEPCRRFAFRLTFRLLSHICFNPYEWCGLNRGVFPLAHVSHISSSRFHPCLRSIFAPSFCHDGRIHTRRTYAHKYWNRIERVGTPLEFAVQLIRGRFLRVRKKAEGSRPTGLRVSPHGLSVFYRQHSSACHHWNRAYGCTILRENMSNA